MSMVGRRSSEGCYDEVVQKLGYRLVLVSSQVPDMVARNSEMNIQTTVRNDGIAAPMSTAPVELVLQQGSITRNLEINGTSIYIYPHFWLGNGTEHTIHGRVWIPNEAEISATWNIFFRVTDASFERSTTVQHSGCQSATSCLIDRIK